MDVWTKLSSKEKTIKWIGLKSVPCTRLSFETAAIKTYIPNLRYVCLFAHSGVQHILCCVFVLPVFVLCTL